MCRPCIHRGDERTLTRSAGSIATRVRGRVGHAAGSAASCHRLVGRSSAPTTTHVERAALIVSELSSNAIQAAPGRTYSLSSPEWTMEVRRSRSVTTRLAVCRRRANRGGSKPASQLRNLVPRGRGLAIVDSLSEDVTVEHHGDDVVVTARVRINYKELGPLLRRRHRRRSSTHWTDQ